MPFSDLDRRLLIVGLMGRLWIAAMIQASRLFKVMIIARFAHKNAMLVFKVLSELKLLKT